MILITGGMGFIALHVACELAESEDLVLGYHSFRRSQADVERIVGVPVVLEPIDVANPYALARVIARYRPSGIIHLAVPGLGSIPPADEIAMNMNGLVNVLEASTVGGVGRVTLASSVAVYGGRDDGPFRECDLLPMASTSPTGAMKKATEVLALHYAERAQLDVVLLRLGMIYGPLYHSLANPPSRLLHYAIKGRPIESWDALRLRSTLDLCYVKDCANGVVRVHGAEHRKHRIYNIGGGRSSSFDELVDAVAEAVPEVDFPEASRSTAVDYHGPPSGRAGTYMDIARAREEFGFAPRFSLGAGIRDYARWLRGHAL